MIVKPWPCPACAAVEGYWDGHRCLSCGHRAPDEPPLTRSKRQPPRSPYDALRSHGVMLSDSQLEDLLAIVRAWNRDRNDRRLPAFTPYQALGEILMTARGLIAGKDEMK